MQSRTMRETYMTRILRSCCAAALAFSFSSLPLSSAFAHCFVGARFFPATLATDDPCVADEMSLPTVAWSKTGDVPPAKELDISGEISKRITEDFGISIGDGWTQIRQPGSATISGFGNLETAFEYQLSKTRRMKQRCCWDWSSSGAAPAPSIPV